MKRSTKTTIAAALLLATATAVTAAPLPKTRTIEIRSSPITFKYGEVHNRWQEPIPFPEDVVAQFANGTMALVDYKLDIVYENGSRGVLLSLFLRVEESLARADLTDSISSARFKGPTLRCLQSPL